MRPFVRRLKGFGNKPDFEPDSEICFCTAVVLGSFIARCSDEQKRLGEFISGPR